MPNLNFWVDLKPYAKFQSQRTTPSGRKVTQGEREKKELVVKFHLI
jgi:hypothetical protein